jgi:hypothetical protein
MDNIIQSIQAALAADATPEARSAGVAACRAVLGALEARPGVPMESAQPSSSPVAAIVASLRGVPVEQLLDLAIARLRSALPAGSEVAPATKGLSIPILPIPGGAR